MKLSLPIGTVFLAGLLLVSPACSLVLPAPPAPPPTAPIATPTVEPIAAPTVVARPGAAPGGGRREIAPLGVRMEPNNVTGKAGKGSVTVEPNRSAELSVGFFEDEVGGHGPSTRAAGWMAVIMSGLLLGIDPTEYQFSYATTGYTDGPSAGALMTVATLAAILGHPLKSDATMTGTINPDGTIGPVGGIPHKIDGAAEAKKTLVLIPAGQRRSTDYQRKQLVDVIERGSALGVEVREVSDIYEAYQGLTGQPLPRPEGRRDAELALPATVVEQSRAKLKEWRTRYDELKRQYQALPAKARLPEITKRLAEADRAAEKATSAEQQGRLGAAYQQMVSATISAANMIQVARILEVYSTGNLTAATTRLRALKPSMKIDALLEQIERRSPTTLSEVVALANAHGHLSLAMGLTEWGDSLASHEITNRSEAYYVLLAGTMMYVSATYTLELSRDALDLGLGGGHTPPPDPKAIKRLAELFRRAAEANLNYFDTVVLSGFAQESGWHLDRIKLYFSYIEPTYLMSSSSTWAMRLIEKRSREQMPSVYATLGGSVNSYVLSSLLVAKYYSLETQFDHTGKVTGIKNEAALIKMLELAETRAHSILSPMVEGGDVPVQALMHYESARVGREGDAEAKMGALGEYWLATLEGQMLGILSGKAKLIR